MQFTVHKTSGYSEETYPPCDGAFLAKHQKWQTRTCSEEEFDKRFSGREGKWRSQGRFHKTLENGNITRREPDQQLWTIEVKNIRGLMKFIEKNGRVIVSTEGYNCPTPDIEIYDDYRE